MPIELSSSSKISFSWDEMYNLIQLLNVEVYRFNIKSFQDIIFKKLQMNITHTLQDFLDILDSTSLNHIQKIVKCPGRTASEIGAFLSGTEIEQNFTTIYGPSNPIGIPRKPLFKSELPGMPTSPAQPFWTPPPPMVNPGIPAGFALFPRPGGPPSIIPGLKVHGPQIVQTPFGFAIIQ